jgi:melanoma-associated antigen
MESAYIGLYTMIIALITANGGSLSEQRLDRYLRRMNADESTPVGRKDDVLKRMEKDGYVVKVKETSVDGGDTVDWMVGPRGKIEVSAEAVATFIRTLYGDDAPPDLEDRLARSLAITGAPTQQQQQQQQAPNGEVSQGSERRRPGRPRRRREDDDDG